jgi:ATP-binding cassette subfamily B protein
MTYHELQQTERDFMIAPAVAEDADIDPMLPSGLECLVIVARQHGLDLTSTQLIKDNLLTEGEV